MEEIERKWKLQKAPSRDIRVGPGSRIVQGYIYTGDVELRVRNIDNLHYMTAKSAGTLRRTECEMSITPVDFGAFWPATESRHIMKRRWGYTSGRQHLDIDVYEGRHGGLVTIEAEFGSEEEARAFTLPKWAEGAVDVTEDKRYKNKNLAVHGTNQIADEIQKE